MALDISGDGRRTAPPRLRKTSASSEKASKEFTDRIAQRNANESQRRSRTPARFTYPILGELFGKDEKGFDLPKKPEVDLGLKKPEVKLAPERQDYDQVMADVWGNLENEGAAGVMKRQRGESTAAPEQQRDQIVQNVADLMNVKAAIGRRDQKRMDREAADRTEKDKVLTAREWAKLTPMQQAAVQANSDLAEAVARDFRTQSKHKSTDEQFKAHENRVSDLFGEEGRTGFKGLEYAPNTLAFLESRGLGKDALAGKTLDDLVSGDALIDMGTLGKLETLPGSSFAQRLAKGQLQYQEDLAAKLKAGKQLIAGLTGAGVGARATEEFGAKSEGQPGHVVLDKVRPETQGQFDIYLQSLARTDSDPDLALKAITADLEERGATPEESAQVWEGLIERTRLAATGEGLWFPGVEFPMRSPAEVAQKLGAPVLKRRGER